MNQLPPFDELNSVGQQLIKISEVEIDLKYSNMELDHQDMVRRNDVIRDLMKLLIGMQRLYLDQISIDAILKWLDINDFELPDAGEIARKLQHSHIQQELYSRGIIDYCLPTICPRESVDKLYKISLKIPMPRVILNQNDEAAVLLTTLANFGIHMILKFTLDPAIGSVTYFMHLLLDLLGHGTIATPCHTCGSQDHGSTAELVDPYQSKILLYNARGAATTSFYTDIAKHFHSRKPHLTVVTETRLPGKFASKLRDF
ncbi:putative DNA binding protein [Corchorus olitorius]|uniref:DNA binding protein n=1 Tax=Corchorus olitorius TaxID=93759 RepID=A0A1R3ICN7_9ROSI|nr:putative DNA binding protein [Corchorus olitorius]